MLMRVVEMHRTVFVTLCLSTQKTHHQLYLFSHCFFVCIDRDAWLGLGLPALYLLIKVHKDGYPGRPVVSQIDDPTYNICKVLTDILNPQDEGGCSKTLLS